MNKVVTVIDDEPSVLHSLGLLLETQGYQVQMHGDANSFLKSSLLGDVIISDVRMPNISGLELLRKLRSEKRTEPIILLTGHGDIDMAVTAMKLGAHDFIEKPYSKERVFQSVLSALEVINSTSDHINVNSELCHRYDSLTERQKETMQYLIQGFSNKEIALKLSISPRTVEIHRTLVMERMGANSLAALVRQGLQLQLL